MHHFAEAITNTKGDALTGYYVKAVDPDTGTVADIYADSSSTPIVSVSGVANAALVDDDGMASFWIDDGTYHLDIYGSDSTTFIRRIESLPMGIASALLESISELTFTTNNYIYGTADNTAAAGTITAFGRSLVDDADAATARTTLGATTVGGNLLTLTNPSAITFLRVNADNSVSALSAAAFRTAIGAGVGGGDLLSTNNLSDLASASTALTNLGFSAFGKTIIDDADAAAVRTTIAAAGSGAATGSGLTMATSRLLGRTTASSGAIEEISVGSGLSLSAGSLSATGSGGAWSLNQTFTWSTNVTEITLTGLAGASDILIVARGLVCAVSSSMILYVSTNNGSSYYTTSGNYVVVNGDTGTETNTTGISVWNTSSTSARSGIVHIMGANVTGAPRRIWCSTAAAGTGDRLFVADNSNDIDAVRLAPSGGGNITAGTVYVFTR